MQTPFQRHTAPRWSPEACCITLLYHPNVHPAELPLNSALHVFWMPLAAVRLICTSCYTDNTSRDSWPIWQTARDAVRPDMPSQNCTIHCAVLSVVFCVEISWWNSAAIGRCGKNSKSNTTRSGIVSYSTTKCFGLSWLGHHQFVASLLM